MPLPDDQGSWNQAYVRFSQLVIDAAAPCHVDNLRVMVSGGTLGY